MLETYTVGSLQESKNKAKHLDKLRSHLISNVWNWARWYQFIWGIAKRNEIPFETKHEVKRKSLKNCDNFVTSKTKSKIL